MNSIKKIPESLQFSLIEEFLDPTIILVADSLEIHFVNKSLLNLLNYDISQLVDQKIEKIVEKSLLDDLIHFCYDVSEVNELEDVLFIKSDLSILKRRIVKYSYSDKNNRFISITLLQNLNSTKELEAIKKCLNLLLDDFPEPIILADLSDIQKALQNRGISNEKVLNKKLRQDRSLSKKILSRIKLLYFNTAIYTLYKMEEIEKVDKKFIQLSVLEKLNSEQIILNSILDKKERFSINVAIRTITNKKLYINATFCVLSGFDKKYERVLIIIKDETEKRKIESTIKRLEERFTAIFESSDIGIAILDSQKRFVEVNKVLQKMSRYSNEELKTMDIDDILFSARGKLINKQIDDIFNNRKEFLQKAVKIMTKENEIVWWKFTVSRIVSKHDEPHYCIALIEDITSQKRIEKERKNHLVKIKSTEKRLRYLSRYLLSVQERERSYISREIHDEIGQVLTAIKIEMQTTIKLVRSKKIMAHLTEAINLVDYTINRARDMSMNLRPSIIDDLGLIPAIRWFLDKEGQRNNLNIKFNSEFRSISIESELKITCYRIIQEAVTNIIRHADTKNIWIDILEKKEEISLIISDDGKGFDIEDVIKKAHEGKSMGVLSMIERAELTGGNLKFSKLTEDYGTVIKVNLRK